MDKIMWRSGTFLQPEHFQFWDECRTEELNVRLSALCKDAWGISKLVLNVAALELGQIELSEFSAILQDGTIIEYPGNCLIPSLDLGRTLNGGENFAVFFNVGAIQRGVKNYCAEMNNTHCNANPSRYLNDGGTKVVFDKYENNQFSQVDLVKYNAWLTREAVDAEVESVLSVKLFEARLQYGGIKISKNYYPTVLDIQYSDALLNNLNASALKIKSALGAFRLDSISKKEALNDPMVRSDYIEIVLLETLHNLARIKKSYCHPRIAWNWIYEFCVRYCAAVNSHFPVDRYEYNHANLKSSFQPMFSFMSVLLQRQKGRVNQLASLKYDGAYFNSYLDPDWFSEYSVVVAVQYASQTAENDASTTFKVGTKQSIPLIIAGSLAGVEMEKCRKSYVFSEQNENTAYYRLKRDGPVWGSIVRDKNIAFLPSKPENIQRMTLLGLR